MWRVFILFSSVCNNELFEYNDIIMGCNKGVS